MKIYSSCFAAALFCLLSACATRSSSDAEQDQKKNKTASINAQLGIAYLEEHEVERAKQKLLLALNQGPTLPEAWYSMAYFLEATGEKQTARRYYLKAIALAPERGDGHNNYGTFLCRSHEYKKAIHEFMTAVKDPAYLNSASAYENAGLCALKIPDKQTAKLFFRQALIKDPNSMIAASELQSLQLPSSKKKNLA